MRITKPHSKADCSQKQGLPAGTALCGESQRDPTEIRRAGDPTEGSTGWCQPPDTSPCPGTARPGQGRSPEGKAHEPISPTPSPGSVGAAAGSLRQVHFFYRVCVTFDSLSHFDSPDTLIQLPVYSTDCKRSGTPAPSSALSCTGREKVIPVKTKSDTE